MVIGSNKKKVYQEFWIRLNQNTANKAKNVFVNEYYSCYFKNHYLNEY